MDELIEDFLVETKEGLEELDNDLVSLEQNPEDEEIIGKIFRVMHTIKGTCGFLGLSRLESVAHAGEDVFDMIRSGSFAINSKIISLVFESLDTIKSIVAYIEKNEVEPEGDDQDIINRLRQCAEGDEGASQPSPKEETKEETKEEAEPEAKEEKQKAKENVSNPKSKPQAGAVDSDELQALFDSTESLVDVGQSNTSDTSSDETSKKEKIAKKDKQPASVIGDSDDLQFDSTEPLIDVGQFDKKEAANKPEKATKKDDDNSKKSKKSATSQTIRVGLDVLEGLMQQASELVLTRNQLMQILRVHQNSDFNAALQRLNAITTELQEGVMKTRMQPVGNAWTKLPRIVRDLSVELDKKIELKMVGEDTELDRQLLELITDPLTHMVRNSCDHGLESPEERVAAGKPESGNIELKAYHGGGYIIIEISDDGRGIDSEKIKKKAIEVGLTTENDAVDLNENQVLQLIFSPGFSTAEKVTSVSGRGVGMDVVKNNIEKISGTVDLASTLGKGSKFTIKIPLTLAIMPVLQVAVSGQKFAIPQINVMEVVKANSSSGFVIETISDNPVLRLRDRLLPLISLSEVLGLKNKIENENSVLSQFIVVCEIGSYKFGVIVEEVFDTEEIVVKPVAPILKSIDVYLGSTILGDGKVIMILDPNGLARVTGDTIIGSEISSSLCQSVIDDSKQANFIVFRAGDKTPKVAPLELISRLEEVDVATIEYSKGEPVIQYRGELMRIINIDPAYKIPETGIQELLVMANGNNIIGLAVEEIMDIAKSSMDKELSGGKDGFLGSMVINDKTCDVVDVSYYFKKTFQDYNYDPTTRASTSSCKTVLLVDDSPFFRKFIPPELKSAGYNVITCQSAEEALDKLNAGEKVSHIVTDINMPQMSGKEFVKICKTNEKLRSIPCVALSAHTEGKEGFNSIEMDDFDAYVSKTNHKELVEILAGISTREKAV